jgi:hypothetical protein
MEDDRPLGPPGVSIFLDGQFLVAGYRDTQNRINQTSRMLSLGFHVRAREHQWTVETARGSYPFADNMTIHRSINGQHEYVTPGREGEGSAC